MGGAASADSQGELFRMNYIIKLGFEMFVAYSNLRRKKTLVRVFLRWWDVHYIISTINIHHIIS